MCEKNKQANISNSLDDEEETAVFDKDVKLVDQSEVGRKLTEIINFIIKNDPLSSIAVNGYDSLYSDLEEETYLIDDAIEEILGYFAYENLGFCGCGSPQETWFVVKNILTVTKTNDVSDSYENLLKCIIPQLDMVDNSDIIKYVGGLITFIQLWFKKSNIISETNKLTEQGENLLYVLNNVEEEFFNEAEFYGERKDNKPLEKISDNKYILPEDISLTKDEEDSLQCISKKYFDFEFTDIYGLNVIYNIINAHKKNHDNFEFGDNQETVCKKYLLYEKDKQSVLGIYVPRCFSYDGTIQMIEYILDTLMIFEHGSSIGSAWLTDEGKEFLNELKPILRKE